jgi:endonuclease G
MSSRAELVADYISRVSAKYDLRKLAHKSRGGRESSEGLESFDPEAGRKVVEAEEGLRAVQEGKLPTPEQTDSMEAIILPAIRPVLDVVGGDFHTDHPLWLKLNDDSAIRASLQRTVPSIGRVELPGSTRPYGGTGFVVGDGMVMTNRHVAAIFSKGLGSRNIVIRPGARAGIDFLRELDRPTGPVLEVKRVIMIHPYWDMALLAVDGIPSTVCPLTLSLRDIPEDGRIEVAAVGYPAFDFRNDTSVQNDLFRRAYGVKRLQPGTYGGREMTDSFGKKVPAGTHDCTTLGGNSGSALIDLETGEVMALHFGGKQGLTNWGVPASELARDPRVVDAGVRFAQGEQSRTDPPWQEWWSRADAGMLSVESGRASTRVSSRPANADPGGSGDTTTPPNSSGQVKSDGSVELVVPIHITVRLGQPTAPSTTVVVGESVFGETTEAMVEPEHDTDYSSRKGYNPRFLDQNIKIDMPRAVDHSVVAKTKNGEDVLHYQNFSIVMHAKRRMSLFTASNVTAEAALKKPEPGRDYTRKGLSGLGKNDQERWFADSRLDDKFQLPDVFYTKDSGAFDKGHVVRREDVAWGKTYDLLRRANGDTYHVTNCSPQVKEFNQSAQGEDNWGDLENLVLKDAKSERYCQFAGPVLRSDDSTFVGTAGNGVNLRVKIPSQYWKVIVVENDTGVAAYGFVLEQDLSDVPLEFAPGAFAKFMEPLADIAMKAGIEFPDIVLNADQFGTTEGEEMAFIAGTPQRSIKEGALG